MSHAYITDLASFLPNAPVSNDQIEAVLGMVGGRPSRSRKLILRNNGITSRHYAIDPTTQRFTHNCAQLAAESIRRLAARGAFAPDALDCLSCGTSGPDQLKPAHAHMVHGELGAPPCEVASHAGVCTSGAAALKYAAMGVASGVFRNAVSSGAEFASSFMRANNFSAEVDEQVEALAGRPELAFEKDFLRWMLSDGAGAALLRAEPNPDRLSLRIDWIDGLSYANEMPPCMYSGADKDASGRLQGWRQLDDPLEALRAGYFAVKQDARLLNEHIIEYSIDRALLTIAERRHVSAEDYAWFLPHYSSQYFRPRLAQRMALNGFEIPDERWFSNLSRVGNVGSASIYLILEELFYSGRLRQGDRLLCYIPESARFSIWYMQLTVV